MTVSEYPEELQLIQPLDSSPQLVKLLKESTVTGTLLSDVNNQISSSLNRLGLYVHTGSEWQHVGVAKIDKDRFEANSRFFRPHGFNG